MPAAVPRPPHRPRRFDVGRRYKNGPTQSVGGGGNSETGQNLLGCEAKTGAAFGCTLMFSGICLPPV